MIACLLLLAGVQAALVPWYELPVATDLHPVRSGAWARFHELFEEKTCGLAASPLFREPYAEASTYYRLWELSGEQPWFDEATPARWRDIALSGSSLAAEALLWETLGRSEDLSATVRFFRTFVSPNLELRRRGERWHARANDPSQRPHPRLERAELMAGLPSPAPPEPALVVGSGLELPELDPLIEAQRQVDLAAWVRLERLGPDQLALSGLLFSRSWELTLRQRLFPRVMGSLALASREADPRPKAWGAGVTWMLPRSRAWSASARVRQSLPSPPDPALETSFFFTLRWLPPGRAPVLMGRWPLGQRPGAPGPIRPSLRPSGPNAVSIPGPT